MDALQMVETFAADGFEQAREYFKSPAGANAEHARDVLKALSAYSRIRATRANEAAIAVAMAKYMGLRGEALAPIWEQITGKPLDPAMLPAPDECLGDDGGVAAEIQALASPSRSSSVKRSRTRAQVSDAAVAS